MASPEPRTSPASTGADSAPREPVRPGALSQLLTDLARAPAVPLEQGWDKELRPGAVIGRFELLRELGRGGFGIVYEALDRELGRKVAFKAVRPGTLASGHDAGWLRDEAEAVARLQHPNIVTLYDVGRCESGPYLVLELVAGETLEERLARGPVPLDEALRIARGVAEGLGHAHAQGVVHRDLKPGNVLLGRRGAKVLDFGLAHVFGRGGVSGGTADFMAPEQRDGAAADPRADVWAAGALLHLLATGVLPGAAVTRRLPRAVRQVLDAALAEDPARRPADGAELARLLDAAEHALSPRARRARWLGAAIALLAAGGGVAGVLAWQQVTEPLARLTVAVADARNGTGDPDLDALSGLVVTSLEQSPRLRVLTRTRLADLLVQSGRGWPERIGEDLAREAAIRADAGALVTADVARDGDGFRVALRGTDPRSGEQLFAVRADAATKRKVADAIDEATEKARRALRESRADVRATRLRTGQVAESLEAYRHYYLGLQCLDRPSLTGTWQLQHDTCAGELKEAISLDPEFALAHYALALAADRNNTDPAPHLASATRFIHRVPPKERALIRAADAALGSRLGEALAHYATIIDAFPDEKVAVGLAGELFHHAGAYREAIPFFERALELDPAMEWPLDHLPFELGALGRHEPLREHARRWERAAPTPGILHALGEAYRWLGEHELAIATARRAVAIAGAPAQEELVDALAAADRLDDAERELRRIVASEGASPPLWASLDLARVLRLQGRRAEASRVVEALGRATPPASEKTIAGKRFQLELPERRSRATQRLCSGPLGPDFWDLCAVALAYAGDLDGAAKHAPRLVPGSPAAELYAALARWRGGDVAGGLAALRAVERRHPLPMPFALPVPSLLLGEAAFEAGAYEESLAALRRFQRLRLDALWRGWAHPRSLVLSARAAEKLGRRDEALADVRRVRTLLAHADAGDADLAEARAIERRVHAAR